MEVGLVNLRITEDLRDGLKSAAEEVLTELFETSTSERCVEVDALENGVDFDGGLGGRGQCALGPLTSGAETMKSAWVRGQIY